MSELKRNPALALLALCAVVIPGSVWATYNNRQTPDQKAAQTAAEITNGMSQGHTSKVMSEADDAWKMSRHAENYKYSPGLLASDIESIAEDTTALLVLATEKTDLPAVKYTERSLEQAAQIGTLTKEEKNRIGFAASQLRFRDAALSK